MKFFHISHTDLDGYACHLLTKEFFKEGWNVFPPWLMALNIFAIAFGLGIIFLL